MWFPSQHFNKRNIVRYSIFVIGAQIINITNSEHDNLINNNSVYMPFYEESHSPLANLWIFNSYKFTHNFMYTKSHFCHYKILTFELLKEKNQTSTFLHIRKVSMRKTERRIIEILLETFRYRIQYIIMKTQIPCK